MNEAGPTPDKGTGRAMRPFLLRVIGASLVVLALGLGAMWGYYYITDTRPIGLNTLGPKLPVLPVQDDPNRKVRLFFTANGATLTPEMREIESSQSTYDRAMAVLGLLIKGPRTKSLRSPIPKGTKIRNLFLVGDTAVLDCSNAVQYGLAGRFSGELLCVYSIVNTLCTNCPDIRKVTILVDGRPIETLGGALDLTAPLVENLALIEPGKTEVSPLDV